MISVTFESEGHANWPFLLRLTLLGMGQQNQFLKNEYQIRLLSSVNE
jgi:hypothetical protein